MGNCSSSTEVKEIKDEVVPVQKVKVQPKPTQPDPCHAPTPVIASRRGSLSHPPTTPAAACDAPTLLAFHVDSYKDASTSPELEVVNWPQTSTPKCSSLVLGVTGRQKDVPVQEATIPATAAKAESHPVPIASATACFRGAPSSTSAAVVERPTQGIGAVGAPASASAGGNITTLWRAFQPLRGEGLDSNGSNKQSSIVAPQSPPKSSIHGNSNSKSDTMIFSDPDVVGISRPIRISKPTPSVPSPGQGSVGVPIESISRESSIAPTILGMNSVSRSSSAAIQPPVAVSARSVSATELAAPTCLVAKDSNAYTTTSKPAKGKTSVFKTPVLQFTPSVARATSLKCDSAAVPQPSSSSAAPTISTDDIKISFLRFNEDSET